MKLAILTPTGDRPEAFALCQRYMQRQTRKPDYWFITDDGVTDTASGVLENCGVWGTMRRLPVWTQPGTSQHRNMLALLDIAEKSDANAFAVIEDDDIYLPHYLERTEQHLRTHELVGEVPARYYNVKTRHWRVFQNTYHASLCQTAFRRSMIQPLRDVIASGQWIDMTFWPKYLSRGLLWDGYNCVGIKGMPGRGGVSNAHRETARWGHHDPNLEKLREWIGRDAQVYAEYVERDELVTDSKSAETPDPQPVTAHWCVSCQVATVDAAGDICERCQSAGAGGMRCKTFQWAGNTMYRCPNHPRCRFDSSSMDTIQKHMGGCPAAEQDDVPPLVGRGLFDAKGNQIR